MATVSHALQTQSQPIAPEILEKVLVGGDLSSLTPKQRLEYIEAVCRSLDINPALRPLEYIELDGKLTLYARANCTDQLRGRHRVSTTILKRERIDSVFAVTARATTPDGREEESIGVVPIVKEAGEWRETPKGKRYFVPSGELLPLRPDELANALMKAETKAKRRVTLHICGAPVIDESELDTLPQARPLRSVADPDTPQPLQDLYDQCGKSLAAYKAGLEALKCQMTEVCGAEKPFYEILQAHGWSDIEDAGSGKTIGQIRLVMRAVYEAIVRARAGIEGMPPVQEVRS